MTSTCNLDSRLIAIMNRPFIHSVSQRILRQGDALDCDLIVSTLGFESRSSFVARYIAISTAKRHAFSFEDRRVLSFEANRRALETSGFSIHDDDRDMASTIRHEIESKAAGKRARVAIDVSSTTRARLATVVEQLVELAVGGFSLDLLFLYCPAVFVEPQPALSEISTCGPVSPSFAGWTDKPDKPTSAIIGLGYEQDRAIGFVEYLEPATVWYLLPVGSDERYSTELWKANRSLLSDTGTDHQMVYRVYRPADTFHLLSSLCRGLLATSRPTICPFGPKLFTLISLLVATLYSPEIAVWRVSAEQAEPPMDQTANGDVVVLSVSLESSQ
jgi:hypothetical protein